MTNNTDADFFKDFPGIRKGDKLFPQLSPTKNKRLLHEMLFGAKSTEDALSELFQQVEADPEKHCIADCFDYLHRPIFMSMLVLGMAGEPIELATVTDQMQRLGGLNPDHGLKRLLDLMDVVDE